MNQTRFIQTSSLIGLLTAYLIIRFPLFDMHGMNQWPLALLVFGLIVMGLSIYFKSPVLSFCTETGYFFGFFIGYFFQQTDANGLNNLWLIWAGSYLIFILIGILTSVLKKRV